MNSKPQNLDFLNKFCNVSYFSGGLINLTELCEVGNKDFVTWKKLPETKELLKQHLLLYNIDITEIYYHGSEVHSVGPISIALSLANWISPYFCSEFCIWLSTKDLINDMKDENLFSKKILEKYEKVHRYKTFDIKGPIYYIISAYCNCENGCRRKYRFKHGVICNEEDFDSRLKIYRSDLISLEINYILKFSHPDIIKNHMDNMFEEQLNPSWSEWFEDTDVNFKEKFISVIEKFMENMFKGKYEIISNKEIEEYNIDARPINSIC